MTAYAQPGKSLKMQQSGTDKNLNSLQVAVKKILLNESPSIIVTCLMINLELAICQKISNSEITEKRN